MSRSKQHSRTRTAICVAPREGSGSRTVHYRCGERYSGKKDAEGIRIAMATRTKPRPQKNHIEINSLKPVSDSSISSRHAALPG